MCPARFGWPMYTKSRGLEGPNLVYIQRRPRHLPKTRAVYPRPGRRHTEWARARWETSISATRTFFRVGTGSKPHGLTHGGPLGPGTVDRSVADLPDLPTLAQHL